MLTWGLMTLSPLDPSVFFCSLGLSPRLTPIPEPEVEWLQILAALAPFGDGLFLFVCLFLFLQIRLSVVYLVRSSTCPPMDSNLTCLGCNSGIDIFQVVVTDSCGDCHSSWKPWPSYTLPEDEACRGGRAHLQELERSQSSSWTTPGHQLCLQFVGYVDQNIMLGWCHFKFNSLLMWEHANQHGFPSHWSKTLMWLNKIL